MTTSVTTDGVHLRVDRYSTRNNSVSPSRRAHSDFHSTSSKRDSFSSFKSTKTYPRKGTTLANANLTYEEQAHLEDVLARFDQVRQIEEMRIKNIHQTMIAKQKVRLKNSESVKVGHCGDCGRIFMPLLNPPIKCINCKSEFCRLCTDKLPNTELVMCKFCRFETLNKCKLGVWFTEELKLSRAAGRVRGVSGPDALRSSIGRIKRESRANSLFQGLDPKAYQYSKERNNDNVKISSQIDERKSVDLYGLMNNSNSVKSPESRPDSFQRLPPISPPLRTESWLEETINRGAQQEQNLLQTRSIDYQPRNVNSWADETPSQTQSDLSWDGRRRSTDNPNTEDVPRSPSLVSSNLTSTLPRDIYSPSLVSSTQMPSGKRFTGSLSDIRSAKHSIQHKKRLDSEVGSRSNLSMASGASYGSSLSIYSERETSYTHGIKITGDIFMAIFFDNPTSTLRVTIKQAREIAVADRKRHTTNPYVKAYLLPDKTKASKRKTSHKKGTCNPVFDEEFKYHILKQDLSSRSLQVSVWHYSGLATNLFLGEVIVPLAYHQFDQTPRWYPLSERRQITMSSDMQLFRGEVIVALKLVLGGTGSSRCELHVWIKSARGLTTSSSGRASKKNNVDSYAKIYLLPGKEKESKRKTKVIKNNNNPEWNTAVIYNEINRQDLASMGVEVSIWDYDRLSSNDFLGGCRLNTGTKQQPWMDATQTEKSIWVAMMERPQTWVEGVIRLRANLN